MPRVAQQKSESTSTRRKKRPVRLRAKRLELSVDLILGWADQFYRRNRRWPTYRSPPHALPVGETWRNLNNCLMAGRRGLPGGTTLARLLVQQRGLRHERYLPPLSNRQILAWADAYHDRTGGWPDPRAGRIPDSGGETWQSVAGALAAGRRGLQQQTLADFLATHRGVRNVQNLPDLQVEKILAWADAHHATQSRWPTNASGAVQGVHETWSGIDAALRVGLRGLPGGSSLARLLAERRGRRNHLAAPRLYIPQILAWADAFHARHGKWPVRASGEIPEAAGETWAKVAAALRQGARGLKQRSSLAELLEKRRGARNCRHLPRLTYAQILDWADRHHARSGRWPTAHGGPVHDAPSETWSGIDLALARGLRKLPGGSSIAKLLAQHRGVRNVKDLPPLSIPQILRWADAFHRRQGRWPRIGEGQVTAKGASGETWQGIDYKLRSGGRGLPGGSSLIRLLGQHRGVRERYGLPRLSRDKILAWADAHHRRTGEWPTRRSGLIVDAAIPDETWARIDHALFKGDRGLEGSTTLARLLFEQRGVASRYAAPQLTRVQIVEWAQEHQRLTGRWPGQKSGHVGLPPREKWQLIDQALVKGFRGLAGGDTLAKLLHRELGVPHRRLRPPLVIRQIVAWARRHQRKTGNWPNQNSGPVVGGFPGDTWEAVQRALRRGERGLPGGDSLAQLRLREGRGRRLGAP